MQCISYEYNVICSFYCILQPMRWLALVVDTCLLCYKVARTTTLPPKWLNSIVGQQNWAMCPTL